MTLRIYFILVFSAAIFTGCVKYSENIQPKPNVKTSPTQTISPIPSVRTDIKPLINFAQLLNKTPVEMAKIYGKPSTYDTKIVQLKNTGGTFGVYDKAGKRYLQVDYYNGKSVAFYLDIADSVRTISPEDTLKLCGLDVDLANAQTKQTGFWWENDSSVNPFYLVQISKFNDTGLYYNCEAHIKVN